MYIEQLIETSADLNQLKVKNPLVWVNRWRIVEIFSQLLSWLSASHYSQCPSPVESVLWKWVPTAHHTKMIRFDRTMIKCYIFKDGWNTQQSQIWGHIKAWKLETSFHFFILNMMRCIFSITPRNVPLVQHPYSENAVWFTVCMSSLIKPHFGKLCWMVGECQSREQRACTFNAEH